MAEDPREKLRRVLLHERKLGCQDTAVFGGLSRFVEHWADEAGRSPAVSRQEVERMDALLSGYSRLEPPEREHALAKALSDLEVPQRPLAQPPPPGPQESSSNRTHLGSASSLPALPGTGHRPPGRSIAADLAAERLETTGDERDLCGPNEVPKRRPLRPRPNVLDQPVTFLKGVGPANASHLRKLGVSTIRDLLYLFPHRHLDYRTFKRIKDLTDGELETVMGTVWQVKTNKAYSRALDVVSAIIADETGTMEAIWFNRRYLASYLVAGTPVVLSGRVEYHLGRPRLKSPDWELLQREDLVHTGRLVPVYPLTEGLNGRWLRLLVKRAVDSFASQMVDHLPSDLRAEADLLDLPSAVSQMHFPDSDTLLRQAQRRLAFDELFTIQLGVLLKRREWRQGPPGPKLEVLPALVGGFVERLPFQLTGAQLRVIEEILGDMPGPPPMVRLLQGEVGSGKTVVATVAMLVAVANGYQAVLMAPTEILAEQHYRTIFRLLESTGWQMPVGDGTRPPTVCLLMGSSKKKGDLYDQIAGGQVDIVVGTHALIQEGLGFHRLGLAVVDEQHRFGVEQRAALRQKGYNPHLLVMTATPIPRTLALTLYGDMDLSVIDELPPGRQQVRTHVVKPSQREKAYAFVRQQVQQGYQAFIICPLVEESDKIAARAATAEYERLKTEVFPDLKLGLLHGRLKPAEKDAVMQEFRRGESNVLVATSVVEVGIDVPNATVMLVEGADRFGLAQLHQFRGRVGRGAAKSYCLLLADSPSAEAQQRLGVLASTHDGFALAEEDLRLRGPGEFFGTRQSGLPDLKVARLSDAAMVGQVREAAEKLFERDPRLEMPEHRLLAEKVTRAWGAEVSLS